MQLDLIPQVDVLGDRRYKISHQDAIEWLRELPSASIDLVLTDPAYESLEKHRARGSTPRLVNWFPIFKNDRFPELFQEVYRVLKNDRHFYMVCDQETMFHVKPIGEQVGFRFWKGIVWDKEKIGMGYHYRAQHEMVLFFEKGKRKLNNLSVPDVLSIPRVANGYPTEKPVELLSILINQSTQPGEIVADPFMGSGSTGSAAILSDRRFVGCDVSDAAIELSKFNLASCLNAALSNSIGRPSEGHEILTNPV